MKTETTAPLFDMSVATYVAGDAPVSAKHEVGQFIGKSVRAMSSTAVGVLEVGSMVFEYLGNEGRLALRSQAKDHRRVALDEDLAEISHMVTRGLNPDVAKQRVEVLMTEYLQ